jgi:hypothetical protein
MATWPSIAVPAFGLTEQLYKRQIRTEFESGAVQSRPAFSLAKRRWPDLGWNALPNADLSTLQTFFDTNQGGQFTWVHPITSVSYECRFSGDSLDLQVVEKTSDGYVWSGKCPIEEV